MRAHLEMLADDLEQGGMTRSEAERQARMRLGGIEQVKESMRDERRLPFIDPVVRDLCYGARMIRRTPGFALVATLTLALAIGANTAVLSIIDAVRFRSLPVENADRLIQPILVYSAAGRRISTTRSSLGLAGPTARWPGSAPTFPLQQSYLCQVERMPARPRVRARPPFERKRGLLVNLDASRTESAGGIAELEQRVLDGIHEVPGVRAAALAGNEVFAGGLWAKTVWVEGRSAADGDQTCRFNLTSPGFLAVAGIPLLLGRDFTTADGPGAPLVALVNEAMAQKYFPGENLIGHRFGDRGPASSGTYEIVGVVANSKMGSLREPPLPAIYQPLSQAGGDVSELVLHVQPTADSSFVAANLRAALPAAAPGLLVTGIEALSDRVTSTFRRERVMTVLASVLGGVTLLLVCVGVFGAASGEVARRAREIGLRMALGARRSQVGWQVTSRFRVLMVGGLTVGLATTLAASRFLRTMLFGVAPTDISTLVIASVIVTTIAVLATVVPAVRASAIDPMEVLRHE